LFSKVPEHVNNDPGALGLSNIKGITSRGAFFN